MIHYGDTQLDVGHVVRSYLQTDEGFVFTSDDGTVWFTDGEDVDEIGATSDKGYYLAADDTGPLAAWVDFTAKAPEFVVYDTSEGEEVLRTSEGNRPGLTSYRDTDAAYVYGVDDGAVYWRSSQGAVRHDLATGDSTVLDPDAMPFDIEDIANGQIAHKTEPAPGNDEGNLAVSADIDGGEPLPRAWNGTLSPEATYIATEQSDVMDVYEVASHDRVTPNVDGYRFWFSYGWANETTVLVVATTGGEQAERTSPSTISPATSPPGCAPRSSPRPWTSETSRCPSGSDSADLPHGTEPFRVSSRLAFQQETYRSSGEGGRMARRDDALFAEFVTARSGALFRTAYLLVGDHGLAQDLLQEGLTKTYVAWPRLRDVGAAEGYARKAITTTAISWWRRKSWRNERPSEMVPDRAVAEATDFDTREWLWQAVQLLPARQRAAVVLRYYEDLTEQQTADTMGCALGTVKSQVSAGLRKLREQVGDVVELDSEYGEVSRA